VLNCVIEKECSKNYFEPCSVN